MKAQDASPLLGIFALQRIGSPKAIPQLLEFATREFTSRKNEEHEWRFFAIGALGTVGDASVVPNLIELLRRFKGWEQPILGALCELADARAHEAVVEVLGRLLDEDIPRVAEFSWSEGHRSDIVHAMEFFKRTRLHTRPEVTALAERLSQPTLWSRLLPEEQAYLRALEMNTWASGIQPSAPQQGI